MLYYVYWNNPSNNKHESYECSTQSLAKNVMAALLSRDDCSGLGVQKRSTPVANPIRVLKVLRWEEFKYVEVRDTSTGLNRTI